MIQPFQKTLLANKLEKQKQLFVGLFFRKLKTFFSGQLTIVKTLLGAGSDESAFFVSVDNSKPELERILKECYLTVCERYGVTIDNLDRVIHLTVGRICLNTKKLIHLHLQKNKDNVLHLFTLSNRALRIANTEVNCVVNMCLYQKAYLSGLLHKQWVSPSGEGRHDRLTKLVIPITEVFPNGLMYPGDVNGNLREVINCKCFCVYF